MISPSALRSLRLVRVHCKRARSVRCLSSEPGQGVRIDTTPPNGKLMFSIFASLAEYERELIRERTKAAASRADLASPPARDLWLTLNTLRGRAWSLAS